MMKRLFLAFVVLCGFSGCHGTTYKDKYIETGEISTLDSVINVHGSTISYLRVHGVTYKNVSGTPPHFLKIPGEEIIVFVTQSDNGREAFVHVAKLKAPEVITISIGDSLFGSGIGKAAEYGGWSRDWIKSYCPEKLVVVNRDIHSEDTITIDLVGRKVEMIASRLFDEKLRVKSEKIIDQRNEPNSEGRVTR
jgi:hypothetical protein